MHMTSFDGPARDGFDLQEFLDPSNATFTRAAGHFHPAKGGTGAAVFAIHLDHACAQGKRHPVAPCAILRLDIVGQTVRRVIGDLDRLGLILKGDDRQDRTKISSCAIRIRLFTSAKTVGRT